MTKHILSAFSGLIIAVTLGCGGESVPDPVAVTGTITQGGKPVSGATIGYSAISEGLPAQYRYAAGTTDDSGVYSIDNVYPAEYQVSVTKAAEAVDLENASAPADLNADELSKYSAESTPLRATVSESATTFDFALE